MYCSKIATGVHHVVKHGEKFSSFFIAEGNAWEALALVGELYLNEHDMHYFANWLTDENYDAHDPYLLLVSLDGKYGVIRRFGEISGWNNNAQIHTFIYDSKAAFGSYEHFLQALDAEVAKDPFLAEKLNYRPKPKPIPKRINFDKIRPDFAPGDIDRDIQAALRNPVEASDDALVWLGIIGPDLASHYPFVYKDAMDELQKRIETNGAYYWTFFFAGDMTMAEVHARAERARKTFESFASKFDVNEYDQHRLIHQKVKRLNNDVLAELTVYAFYSEVQGTGWWKHFLGELQGRYPGTTRDSEA